MSFEIGNLLTVVVESPKGNATLKFVEMPYNEFLMLQSNSKNKGQDSPELVDQFSKLLGYCRSIEGVVDVSTGEAVSLERLKSGTLPTSFVFATTQGYIQAMLNSVTKGSDDPKKESAAVA